MVTGVTESLLFYRMSGEPQQMLTVRWVREPEAKGQPKPQELGSQPEAHRL